MPYLFVHFREKLTVDGEQVHFAVSQDGYRWQALNDGRPILTCDKGDLGCRDIEIVRLKEGGFVILATDLCIVRHMDEDHNVDWKQLNHYGSQYLSLWRSEDLITFSEQELIHFGRHDFGCLWAPEVFFDEINDEYLIHWGSTVQENDFSHMSIYSCTTKDFRSFSTPKLFFTKENEILDSHLVKLNDVYHLFYKNSSSPSMNLHAVSNALYGPYFNDERFQDYMATLDQPGAYEAPTTLILPDGNWCLFLDFFGCEKEKMGYVPFLSSSIKDAAFQKANSLFTFPYGFKHGHAIEISQQEYELLCRAYA